MLDVQQFKTQIIVPTLQAFEELGLYSEAAINLMLGTALTESRLSALLQYGGGPALGLFQIEPLTLDDIYKRYLQREDKKELLGRVHLFMTARDIHEQVISNLPFAVIMARIRYFMVPEALPDHDDLEGLADYYKKFYNTIKGSGTIQGFIENYNRHVLEIKQEI